MYVTETMFRVLWGNINTYFIVFVLLLQPNMVNVSTMVGFIFGLSCTAIFMYLTMKTSAVRTYRYGAYWTIVNTLAILAIAVFRPAHLAIWFVVLSTLLNFGKAGVTNATQVIFTFIPDVDEMVTGKRREGQYAGNNSTLDNIYSSLEIVLIGAVLSGTGFAEKASTQGSGTVLALLIMYTGVPIVLAILGIISSFFFKLSTHNHKILLTEIRRLRDGGSMADVTPETREVVETLTGFKYEDCWGHNNMMQVPKFNWHLGHAHATSKTK